jgi:hypothetical protein
MTPREALKSILTLVAATDALKNESFAGYYFAVSS